MSPIAPFHVGSTLACFTPVFLQYTVIILSRFYHLMLMPTHWIYFIYALLKHVIFFFLIRKKTPTSPYTPYATVLGIGHWL